MSAAPNASTSTIGSSRTVPKLRSCATCRSRKVRCDKLSPCTNCRRANIACVLPVIDRRPRWARRLERANIPPSSTKITAGTGPDVGQLVERLHGLESLVKSLSGQLEHANAIANFARSGPSGVNSPGSSAHNHDADHEMDNTTAPQKLSGRLVVQDTNRTRYLSSSFWTKVNDQVG